MEGRDVSQYCSKASSRLCPVKAVAGGAPEAAVADLVRPALRSARPKRRGRRCPINGHLKRYAACPKSNFGHADTH